MVRSASGARFFVKVVFPTFSDDEDEEANRFGKDDEEDEASRFAKDDDVDDENDERRFWVDILDQNQFLPRSYLSSLRFTLLWQLKKERKQAEPKEIHAERERVFKELSDFKEIFREAVQKKESV